MHDIYIFTKELSRHLVSRNNIFFVLPAHTHARTHTRTHTPAHAHTFHVGLLQQVTRVFLRTLLLYLLP